VGAVSADAIAERLRSDDLPLSPGLDLDASSVREVATPAGEAVEIALTVAGRHGTFALLAAGGQSYELVFLSAGSDKAEADFGQMLTSLRES
jgi:hypothetical protein